MYRAVRNVSRAASAHRPAAAASPRAAAISPASTFSEARCMGGGASSSARSTASAASSQRPSEVSGSAWLMARNVPVVRARPYSRALTTPWRAT